VQTLHKLAIIAAVRLTCRADDEEGQTLIEYGLIISFVSIVSVVIVATIGSKVPGFFTVAASKLHS
jgi:Flp pilus assembly pilin Flp